MPGIFGLKYFNDEVFGKYVESIPRVKQNAFLTAGVLRTRNELKNMLRDQTGGNFITVPMTGRISGAADNYDGNTNISEGEIGTYAQSMIVVGRAKGWKEQDFSYDLTGKDFMEVIGQQISDYWDDVDQATILATLAGIFGVTDAGFSTSHTYDISSAASAADTVVGPASLNNAIQQAAGANKNIFTMAIMHSAVATNLENLELLEYRKATDSNGIQRQIGLADWNGRTVLVDDDVPTETSYTSAGVYTVTIGGTVATGEKFVVDGAEFTVSSTETPTAVATGLATALGSNAHYSVSRDGAILTLTEKSGQYGYGVPTVSTTSAAGTIIPATTTAPASHTNYVTYILGQGAFDYCDVGAKVPYETDRDAKTKGGIDMLYTRQRKIFAPYGFSFKQPSTPIVSPTDVQLSTAARWGLVKDTTGNGFIDTKAIPIARIISRG